MKKGEVPYITYGSHGSVVTHLRCGKSFSDDFVANLLLTFMVKFLSSVLWHCWLGGRKSIWPVKQESLANAKVNVRQHCVVRSHWNDGNAIWRTTMFHVVASQTHEITRNSERIRPCSSSRSSKVIDLGVNGKPICDFLLVINSNFSRIWYRFRDIDA